MNGLTNYITEQAWVDTITIWYVLVDDAGQRVIAERGNTLRTRGPEPEVSDSEIITIGLIIETFFQGHEETGYAFVTQYLQDLFPRTLNVDRFNARRRALTGVIELVRRDLRNPKLATDAPVRLVDSAPVTLMTYTRGNRSRSVIGSDYFGVVTSKKARFFGLRLHVTTTTTQLIDEWVLAPAAAHDVKVLDALVADSHELVLVGDKAYNDTELEERLWRKRRIQLLPLRRTNQKQQWPDAVRRALGSVRHRVETVFSVLTTAFNIQHPRGRSLVGHVVRVATCILAHTLSFFMV